MAIILAIIISLVVYLGGGWCAYNIYMSFQDIDNMTIQSLYSSEILTYNIVAIAFSVLFGSLAEGKGHSFSDSFPYIIIGLPLVMWALCVYVLPISYGASILNTVVNIIVLCVCCVMWLRRVL